MSSAKRRLYRRSPNRSRRYDKSGNRLDPEPPDGKYRIRQGTAEDRRVSVEDKDMRHGRESKSKRFNRYKGHIACDLGTELIIACGVTTANRPGAEVIPALQADIRCYPDRNTIGQLSIDRGYIKSPVASEVFARGGEVPEGLPVAHIERAHPAEGAVPGVLELTAHRLAGLHRDVRVPALEGLDARLLVYGNDVLVLRRLMVDAQQIVSLRAEFVVV